MSCYQLIITIAISHKSKSFIEEELLIVILNIIIKNMPGKIACKMAVMFFSKRSPGTSTSAILIKSISSILQSQYINVVAGGLVEI